MLLPPRSLLLRAYIHSRSLGGIPTRSAITRIGSSADTDVTKSHSCCVSACSTISTAFARIDASIREIILGANPRETIFLKLVWRGGSILIMARSAPCAMLSMFVPWAEENVCQSLFASTTSAYRESTQKPAPSGWGCRYTGAFSRSHANVSCGTPRTNTSRSYRSSISVPVVICQLSVD
jgi:hypothetical protein